MKESGMSEEHLAESREALETPLPQEVMELHQATKFRHHLQGAMVGPHFQEDMERHPLQEVSGTSEYRQGVAMSLDPSRTEVTSEFPQGLHLHLEQA
jgi:hypothetical protein